MSAPEVPMQQPEHSFRERAIHVLAGATLVAAGGLATMGFSSLGEAAPAPAGPEATTTTVEPSNGNFISTMQDGDCLADPHTFFGHVSYAQPVTGEVDVTINGIAATVNNDPENLNSYYSAPVESIPAGGMEFDIHVGQPDGINFETTMPALGCEVTPADTTTTTEAATTTTTTAPEATTTTTTEAATTTTTEAPTTTKGPNTTVKGPDTTVKAPESTTNPKPAATTPKANSSNSANTNEAPVATAVAGDPNYTG